MARGNNKQPIFREDSDKTHYLNLLQNFRKEHEIDFYHYCLMNNHLHLILQARRPKAFSNFMMRVGLSYFFHFRKKYGYVGHFFQNRFKSNIIDCDLYLLNCGKYIELNPVRGGITARPEDYPFSSYGFYCHGMENSLLRADPVFLALSENEERRREVYREIVVDDKIVSGEKLKKQRYIGSEVFVKKMEGLVGFPNERKPQGRPRKGK